ncbi:MAG: M23 family metallopeptidase [Anaerolineales bacterium]|nr:M23 family metallopeptidase [Anaerolineales bacterium]
MAAGHIILLPRQDYYKWVRAVQKYALHFGVGITPDPQKVADQQVATVIAPPNGYPKEGDILLWLKMRYPNILIDYIFCDSQFKLVEMLDARIRRGKPYGKLIGMDNQPGALPLYRKDRLYLFWPTDYGTILQPFGANQELYMQYGLPGHEGVDIRAPHGANVYACADGEVYLVENRHDQHNYGVHVRIRHSTGYRTIYAHLERALVRVGEQVKARQLIGRADSTGNSSGNHLHLTLKKDGATERGETDYPLDIIDPTPFLVYKHQEAEVFEALGMRPVGSRLEAYPWSWPCLVGLNSRLGGTMQEIDFEVLQQARIEAVTIYRHTSKETIQRVRAVDPSIFLLARMNLDFRGIVLTGRQWAERMYPDFTRLSDLGIQYFEIQHMPNLQQNGWRTIWNSGEAFGAWWEEATGVVREQFPQARFGFPGVLPGGQIPGLRMDGGIFMDGADQAMMKADWLGVNCFWNSEGMMDSPEFGRGYLRLRERYPHKLIFITEFANINPYTNPNVKGREYRKYLESLRNQPGIGAAFAQVVSAARGYDALVWRNESGLVNRIAEEVGNRGG